MEQIKEIEGGETENKGSEKNEQEEEDAGLLLPLHLILHSDLLLKGRKISSLDHRSLAQLSLRKLFTNLSPSYLLAISFTFFSLSSLKNDHRVQATCASSLRPVLRRLMLRLFSFSSIRLLPLLSTSVHLCLLPPNIHYMFCYVQWICETVSCNTLRGASSFLSLSFPLFLLSYSASPMWMDTNSPT